MWIVLVFVGLGILIWLVMRGADRAAARSYVPGASFSPITETPGTFAEPWWRACERLGIAEPEEKHLRDDLRAATRYSAAVWQALSGPGPPMSPNQQRAAIQFIRDTEAVMKRAYVWNEGAYERRTRNPRPRRDAAFEQVAQILRQPR